MNILDIIYESAPIPRGVITNKTISDKKFRLEKITGISSWVADKITYDQEGISRNIEIMLINCIPIIIITPIK